ncbi:uncharacterized protein LOC128931339 isoform X2 [Callithrix jacchus]
MRPFEDWAWKSHRHRIIAPERNPGFSHHDTIPMFLQPHLDMDQQPKGQDGEGTQGQPHKLCFSPTSKQSAGEEKTEENSEPNSLLMNTPGFGAVDDPPSRSARGVFPLFSQCTRGRSANGKSFFLADERVGKENGLTENLKPDVQVVRPGPRRSGAARGRGPGMDAARSAGPSPPIALRAPLAPLLR